MLWNLTNEEWNSNNKNIWFFKKILRILCLYKFISNITFRFYWNFRKLFGNKIIFNFFSHFLEAYLVCHWSKIYLRTCKRTYIHHWNEIEIYIWVASVNFYLCLTTIPASQEKKFYRNVLPFEIIFTTPSVIKRNIFSNKYLNILNGQKSSDRKHYLFRKKMCHTVKMADRRKLVFRLFYIKLS